MQVGDKVRVTRRDFYSFSNVGIVEDIESDGRLVVLFPDRDWGLYGEADLELVVQPPTFTRDEMETLVGALGLIRHSERFPNIAMRSRPLYDRIYEYLINTEGDEG